MEGMYKLSNSVVADLQYGTKCDICYNTRYALHTTVFSNIKVYSEDGSKMLLRNFATPAISQT